MREGGVIMPGILNATYVRNNWGEFIDNVVRSGPSVVKRNRDYFAALSLDHLQYVLDAYNLNLEYEQEEDGSFSGSLEGLDLVANAPTLEALKKEIANDLAEYAEEYMENFELYFQSFNRRSHFPYLLKVSVQNDSHEVEKLINA